MYLLDTALAENAPDDRAITDSLKGGDERYRLMNEGHAALLTLALLAEEATGSDLRTVGDAERERVRERCVFTTHTAVPAGHDRFPLGLVREVTATSSPCASPAT